MQTDYTKDTKRLLMEKYGISQELYELCSQCEQSLSFEFRNIEKIAEFNHLKVLHAMQECGISDRHFAGTCGYGYDDIGRDAIEEVYAKVFGCEDALVRGSILSGTVALATLLYGILRPGDEIIAATGKPYDTLEGIIGIKDVENKGSLKDFGVTYKQVDLLENLDVDFEGLRKAVTDKTTMVMIQRSKGYAFRHAFSIDTIEKIVKTVKEVNPNCIVMCDNCYGEFVETREPTDVGVDIMAGSLIKNPGGGLALSGGYIAGRRDLVSRASDRYSAPGLGKHVGASLGSNRWMMQGFYMAPHIVSQAVKGAVLIAALMEHEGYETMPHSKDPRADIVQAIKFGSPEKLRSFCASIQAAAPVDSFVVPEEWDMPGYDAQVIMAAGAFVQGSSIELSSDGTMTPPYIAYMQGGLIYENVKLAGMMAVKRLRNLN